MKNSINRLVSIAPMMDCTDRHYRWFMRLITQKTLLYTEMITTGAIIHGDRDRFLRFNVEEHPLALQLGGSNPQDLAECCKIAEDLGYDEVNLNVGCPSDRVQAGRFGACLMKEPELVAECFSAMQSAVNIPITIKTRTGVDKQDSYENLCRFIEIVKASGCKTFILHARKAWLTGLSPKENRNVPPLQYETVYRLKRNYSSLEIIINGGIKTSENMRDHLQYIDGVMLGREAYSNPYLFAQVDRDFYSTSLPLKSRQQVVLEYLPYIFREVGKGVSLRRLTRPLVGLFQGVPGAKQWRRSITEDPESWISSLRYNNSAAKAAECQRVLGLQALV